MELKRRSKRVFLKRFLVVTTVGLLITAVGLSLYMWYLATIIDKRFSARRWSIPSRVYSDSMLLYPGQTANLKLFYEKLHHLEYHDVSRTPELKGEMHRKESVLDIYLHDLAIPSKKREGFPVRIVFQDNRIASIERLDTHQHVPILEIEPEEIMLFFGREQERRQEYCCTRGNAKAASFLRQGGAEIGSGLQQRPYKRQHHCGSDPVRTSQTR